VSRLWHSLAELVPAESCPSTMRGAGEASRNDYAWLVDVADGTSRLSAGDGCVFIAGHRGTTAHKHDGPQLPTAAPPATTAPAPTKPSQFTPNPPPQKTEFHVTGIQAPSAPPATPVPTTPALEFATVQGGRPGGRATVTVRTAPGAQCSIAYTTPAGTTSTTQGLTPKAAGSDGSATWSRVIGANTRPGTGTVSVTCAGMRASSSIQID
jgi:hypothetical protein